MKQDLRFPTGSNFKCLKLEDHMNIHVFETIIPKIIQDHNFMPAKYI